MMAWRVEILNETVASEIAALPADMQARFLRLAEHIVSAGLQSLGEPHVKHLEGKLWELRLTGRDGIARALYVTAIGRRVVVVRAFVKKTQKTPRAEIELALRRSYAGFWVTRRSGGVICRHIDDLSAVFESDTSDDFWQLVCSIQSPPSL
jgi:phage-related protein